jgi:hypothetical protein
MRGSREIAALLLMFAGGGRGPGRRKGAAQQAKKRTLLRSAWAPAFAGEQGDFVQEKNEWWK